MNWRKLNRSLHRDLGYLFFGMTLIYAVSGIVLNHRKPGGDASIVTRSETFQSEITSKDQFTRNFIDSILEQQEISTSAFKNYYFKNNQQAMIYLKQGHISYNLDTGEGTLVIIRKRPVLTRFNFLHYNKPKKLWTVFSDLYAVSLLLIALSGLFILRGKYGIRKRGAVLTLAGILIPLVFLFIYYGG